MSLDQHLEKLAFFREVALSGSFSRASSRLRLSQPTLSRAVRILEDDLQCALFTRSRRGIVLTAKGKVLLEFANQISVSAHATEMKLREGQTDIVSTLRLGTHESISIYYFPALIAHLRSVLPRLQINLKTGRSRNIIDHLMRNEIDIAITVNPPRSRQFRSTRLFSDHFNFYISPRLSETKNEPLILMVDALESSGKTLLQRLGQSLNYSGALLECENHETVRALTGEALGIGLMPDHVAENDVRRGLLVRYSNRRYPSNIIPHEISITILRERERELKIQAFSREAVRLTDKW